MSSRSLRQNESVRAAIRRVMRFRIDRIVKLLDCPSPVGIHEARKQLKQVRALLRLIGPGIRKRERRRADDRLHEVTLALSPLRDSTVLLATLRRLDKLGLLTAAAFASLRSAVQKCSRRSSDQVLGNSKQRRHLVGSLLAARRQASHWRSIHRGWKALGPGLRQTYSAGRAAASALDGSDEALHRLRKRAKDLFYSLEFLRGLQPDSMRTATGTARRLADCLGDDRDLALLEQSLRRELNSSLAEPELKELTRSVAQLRKSLQRKGRDYAHALYSKNEEAFVSPLRVYWRKWRRGAMSTA